MRKHAFTPRWASGQTNDTTCSICGRDRSEHEQATAAATLQAILEYRAKAGAVVCPDNKRDGQLASVFGEASCFLVEQSIFRAADLLMPAYRGGYWDFVHCPDGGFYLALDPRRTMRVSVEGNGYDGEMSGDAAGIVVCMFVYSNMSFGASGDLQRTLTQQYRTLREYLAEHPEASSIWAAID